MCMNLPGVNRGWSGESCVSGLFGNVVKPLTPNPLHHLPFSFRHSTTVLMAMAVQLHSHTATLLHCHSDVQLQALTTGEAWVVPR